METDRVCSLNYKWGKASAGCGLFRDASSRPLAMYVYVKYLTIFL